MVRIEPPIPATLQVAKPLGPSALLPIGRVLDAVVIQQRVGQLYELSAGPLRLLAESQQPLRPGEQLTLRVTGRDAEQRPTLEILPPAAKANTTPFLKNVVPQQRDATQLMAALWQLSQSKPDNPTLQQAARVLEQLPGRQQLSEPAALQRTLQNSGLFLESMLQSGRGLADGDLKVALLKLLRTLGGQRQAAASPPPTTAPTREGGSPQPAQPSAQAPAQASTQSPQSAPKTQGQTPATTTTPASGKAPGAATPGAEAARPASGETTPTTRTPVGADTYTRPAPTTAAPPRGGEAVAPPPREAGTLAQQTFTAPRGHDTMPGQIQPMPKAEVPPIDLANIGRMLGQLAQSTESTLARLESHQLLHLQTQDSNTPQWLMEIPVRDKDGVDLWQLHIAREDTGKTDAEGREERVWHLTLSFDFDNTGPVIARVEYSKDRTVVNFYASVAQTDGYIGEQMDALQQLLEEKGIHSVTLHHHQGLPHRDVLPQPLHSLVEDQA